MKANQIIPPFAFVILLVSLSYQSTAQDWAIKNLEASPRHHEWVDITYNDRTVTCFIAYPEVSQNIKAIILIHENRGLNDWARNMTDQLAGEGYIAIAPDLLSGRGPDGGRTSDFATSDDARTAIYKLSPDQVTADLNAVLKYTKALPASNGKIAVIGFCWGGSQTFRYATNQTDLDAAFVCYGTGPKDIEEIRRIQAPVYGFYGENDNRVNATIAASESVMEKEGKAYFPVIYEGGGHGFFRAGEAPEASEGNKSARGNAWKRLVTLLKD